MIYILYKTTIIPAKHPNSSTKHLWVAMAQDQATSHRHSAQATSHRHRAQATSHGQTAQATSHSHSTVTLS